MLKLTALSALIPVLAVAAPLGQANDATKPFYLKPEKDFGKVSGSQPVEKCLCLPPCFLP